jgi:hypothetical protein
MELERYVQDVHHQLAVAAEAGGEEARDLAERLLAAVDPAVRLTLLGALGDAAAEITSDLAPGSVDVRLRGREPSFVVTLPPTAAPAAPDQGGDDGDDGERGDRGDRGGPATSTAPPPAEGDDELSRINLRLPTHLKTRVEQASARDGHSINAWLVRAVAAAVERDEAPPSRGRRVARGGQQFTGWVR